MERARSCDVRTGRARYTHHPAHRTKPMGIAAPFRLLRCGETAAAPLHPSYENNVSRCQTAKFILAARCARALKSSARPRGGWSAERRTRVEPVSYTHLDVYKRQGHDRALGDAARLVRQGVRVRDHRLPHRRHDIAADLRPVPRSRGGARDVPVHRRLRRGRGRHRRLRHVQPADGHVGWVEFFTRPNIPPCGTMFGLA